MIRHLHSRLEKLEASQPECAPHAVRIVVWPGDDEAAALEAALAAEFGQEPRPGNLLIVQRRIVMPHEGRP